jgi:DNA-binding transcriptional MerR regulator
MSRYRISELAGPTGFSPSTLRYYEQVGLLSAERARNGYRVYGEADVVRLHFIARAKRLGLSLGGIRELVSIWDGGRCEAVQARLSEMLAAGSRATAKRIGELVAFDAELAGARQSLAAATPAGPCDDSCGCTAGHPDHAESRGGPDDRPDGAGRPPFACTLRPSDLAERVREWTDMLGRAAARREVDGGVRITFPADPELIGRLASLAVREQRCCAFLTFAIVIAGADRVTLEVRAPREARQLLPRLFAAA